MSMLPYRKLQVWQSFALAMEILDFCESGPISKRYYYRDQLCDAAMSVPANIAQGNGRSTPLDYASFLDRTHGSLCELDTWLESARHRRWLDETLYERWEGEIVQLSPTIHALTTKVRAMNRLPSRSG